MCIFTVKNIFNPAEIHVVEAETPEKAENLYGDDFLAENPYVYDVPELFYRNTKTIAFNGKFYVQDIDGRYRYDSDINFVIYPELK